MAEHLVLKEWGEIKGDAGLDSVIQPEGSRLDLSKYSEVLVRFDYMKLNNARIVVDTGSVRESVGWKETAVAPSGGGSVILRRDIGRTSDFLDNFIRWRLDQTAAAAFYGTFRIEVICVR